MCIHGKRLCHLRRTLLSRQLALRLYGDPQKQSLAAPLRRLLAGVKFRGAHYKKVRRGQLFEQEALYIYASMSNRGSFPCRWDIALRPCEPRKVRKKLPQQRTIFSRWRSSRRVVLRVSTTSCADSTMAA